MEFLKEILGDDIYNQVAEKLKDNANIKLANIANGSYIPKDKFDSVNNDVKTYKAQLTELQTQLEAVKASAAGNQQLQAEIQKLQTQLTEKDAEMKQQAFNIAVKDSIRGYKVHDPDVIMPLLDMKTIAQGENGSIVGLKEQLEAMKTARPYLFIEENSSKGGFGGSTTPPAEKPSPNDAINAAIRGAAGK
ncbi:MAG: scaffolding protein [Actinomycetaceae bacterium]|nr:scaffolding protein [Actinomycetaceae bacterium]